MHVQLRSLVKDRKVILTHSLNILHEYQNLINEVGTFMLTDMEAAQSSAEGFLELFVNRQVLIFNDLDPAFSLSPCYEAETYINNLLLWYPDGMTFKLDLRNARVGISCNMMLRSFRWIFSSRRLFRELPESYHE